MTELTPMTQRQLQKIIVELEDKSHKLEVNLNDVEMKLENHIIRTNIWKHHKVKEEKTQKMKKNLYQILLDNKQLEEILTRKSKQIIDQFLSNSNFQLKFIKMRNLHKRNKSQDLTNSADKEINDFVFEDDFYQQTKGAPILNRKQIKAEINNMIKYKTLAQNKEFIDVQIDEKIIDTGKIKLSPQDLGILKQRLQKEDQRDKNFQQLQDRIALLEQELSFLNDKSSVGISDQIFLEDGESAVGGAKSLKKFPTTILKASQMFKQQISMINDTNISRGPLMNHSPQQDAGSLERVVQEGDRERNQRLKKIYGNLSQVQNRINGNISQSKGKNHNLNITQTLNNTIFGVGTSQTGLGKKMQRISTNNSIVNENPQSRNRMLHNRVGGATLPTQIRNQLQETYQGIKSKPVIDLKDSSPLISGRNQFKYVNEHILSYPDLNSGNPLSARGHLNLSSSKDSNAAFNVNPFSSNLSPQSSQQIQIGSINSKTQNFMIKNTIHFSPRQQADISGLGNILNSGNSSVESINRNNNNQGLDSSYMSQGKKSLGATLQYFRKQNPIENLRAQKAVQINSNTLQLSAKEIANSARRRNIQSIPNQDKMNSSYTREFSGNQFN
eukprot:403374745